jgi:hypothetical protein
MSEDRNLSRRSFLRVGTSSALGVGLSAPIPITGNSGSGKSTIVPFQSLFGGGVSISVDDIWSAPDTWRVALERLAAVVGHERGWTRLERALAAESAAGANWFATYKRELRVAKLEVEAVEQPADSEQTVVQRFTVVVAYTDVMHLLKFSAFLVSGTGNATSFDFTSAFGGRLADAHRRITQERDTDLNAATMPREPGRNGTFDTFEFPYPTQPEEHKLWRSNIPPNKNCLSF